MSESTERKPIPESGVESPASPPKPRKPGRLGRSMRNIHAVAVADWRRLSTNVVAIVVLMGLAILPALYGWFNIMSNWSPYSEDKTSKIKVAVTSEDMGVNVLDLVSLNIGDQVMDNLKKNTVIGWQFTETKDEAVNGVVSGDYYAAIVIPEDFSEQIISVITGFIEHPHVEYYENMKRNAIAPKITGKAQTSVTQQINETFQGEIVSVVSKVGEVLSNYDADGLIASTIKEVETLRNDVTAYISLMESLNLMVQSTDQTMAAVETTLPYMRDSMFQIQDSMNNIDSIVNSDYVTGNGSSAIGDIQDWVNQNLGGGGTSPSDPAVDPAVDPAADPATPAVDPAVTAAAEAVHNSVMSVNMALDGAIFSIEDLETSVGSIRNTLWNISAKLTEIQGTLGELQADLGTMYDELNKIDLAKMEKVLSIINQDGEDLIDFIKAPVSVETIRVYPVETYGSTTAPFYSVLAIWIGSLILVVIIHTKVLPEPGLEELTGIQRFFGRFVIFFVLGQIQALLIVLGDLFFIGIQCTDPVLFWLACSVSSTTFTLMMYALVYALDNVGEAAGLVLLVIQVAGSGGSYPIEVLPVVYQKMYKFMPFAYAMNAIRETIVGRYHQDYWRYMSYMPIFIAVSFGIALLQKPCERLMEYIEEKKADAYLMK